MGAVRAPRYFGANQARAERNRGLKRLRLGHAQEALQSSNQKALANLSLSLPLPGFIPFQEHKRQVYPTATTSAAQFIYTCARQAQQAQLGMYRSNQLHPATCVMC